MAVSYTHLEEAYNEHVLSLYKGKAKFLMSGLDGAKAAILGAAAMESHIFICI